MRLCGWGGSLLEFTMVYILPLHLVNTVSAGTPIPRLVLASNLLSLAMHLHLIIWCACCETDILWCGHPILLDHICFPSFILWTFVDCEVYLWRLSSVTKLKFLVMEAVSASSGWKIALDSFLLCSCETAPKFVHLIHQFTGSSFSHDYGMIVTARLFWLGAILRWA